LVKVDGKVAFGHFGFRLLKLDFDGSHAPAKRNLSLGKPVLAAEIRDMGLIQIFPSARPSAAAIAANSEHAPAVRHLRAKGARLAGDIRDSFCSFHAAKRSRTPHGRNMLATCICNAL
jgi:hypothetical protein